MAARKTLVTAVLLLSAVAANAAAVAPATGDGELRGEDYEGPMAGVSSVDYAVCRIGCLDSFYDCKDWCEHKGYKNGGVCVPPYRQQCCCFRP